MSSDKRWLHVRRGHYSAARVLEQCGVSEPPVPIFDIAGALCIPVSIVSSPGWAGALHVVEHPPAVQVWLRAEDPQIRQRFTLAHELGHLFLRHPGPIFRDETFAGTREEAAANGYAANLLMPLPWVQRFASFYAWDVEYLSSAFQVSEGAMRIRLQKLSGLT